MATGNSTNQGLGTTAQVLIGGTSQPAFSSTVTGDGDFTFTTATSGNSKRILASNSSNTASSTAILEAQTAGTSSGNAFTRYTVGTNTSWAIGCVSQATTPLQIRTTGAATAAPNSGTQVWVATTAGEITKPQQPAFLANHSGSNADVTGNNTVFTLTLDNEVYDVNSDFNPATYTFTAPVTGKYLLCASVAMQQVNTATFSQMIINTSNRGYYAGLCSPTGVQSVNNTYSISRSVLADMDAADTCTITIQLNGIGADTADTLNSTNYYQFSGCLVC